MGDYLATSVLLGILVYFTLWFTLMQIGVIPDGTPPLPLP